MQDREVQRNSLENQSEQENLLGELGRRMQIFSKKKVT